MAPEAILIDNPTCKRFNAKGTHLTILNYTDIQISFDAMRMMKVCNRVGSYEVTRAEKEDRNILAYHVPGHPEVICLQYEILKTSKGTGCFRYLIIKKPNSDILCLRRVELINRDALKYDDPTNRLLFGLKPKNIDFDEFGKNDTNISTLINAIASEASPNLINEVLRYKTATTRFTILNKSKHRISIDHFHGLCIDEQVITNFSKRDCQIIAYDLDFFPEIVCFEQKNEALLVPQSRIFASFESGKWKIIIILDNFINNKYLQKSRDRKNAFSIWKSAYDISSSLGYPSLPKEILKLILGTYLLLPINKT